MSSPDAPVALSQLPTPVGNGDLLAPAALSPAALAPARLLPPPLDKLPANFQPTIVSEDSMATGRGWRRWLLPLLGRAMGFLAPSSRGLLASAFGACHRTTSLRIAVAMSGAWDVATPAIASGSAWHDILSVQNLIVPIFFETMMIFIANSETIYPNAEKSKVSPCRLHVGRRETFRPTVGQKGLFSQ